MKKTAILVLFVMCVSITSCGNKSEQETATGATTTSDVAQNATNTTNPAQPKESIVDINTVEISTADLGDFPYFKLPDGYKFSDPDHAQNGTGKGLTSDYDKEYFLSHGVYVPIEGKTFKGHITVNRNVKDKAFAPLELQKSFDDLIAKSGGVKINNGRGYHTGEKERIKALDPQAEASGYMNSSQYYDNIHTYVIRKPDHTVWVQHNLGGETGYITVLKTEAFENKMSLLKSDQIQKELTEKGKVVLHINFDTDKATLKTDGKDAVAEISKALQTDNNLKISINGYTDNTGNASHNLQLSKDRAETVKKALLEAGIENNRLTSDGFGSENPMADNSTEDGKAQNRRVELIKR